MTLECFEKQIGRLAATYGDRNYPVERAKAMFGELKDFTDVQFETAVSHFILTSRHAPLLPEFIEAKTKLEAEDRERRRMGYDAEPEPLNFSLKNIPGGGPHRSFVSECKKILESKLNGTLNRTQFDQACGVLAQVAHATSEGVSGAPCRFCVNLGYRLEEDKKTGARFMFRCNCRIGNNVASGLIFPKDRNGNAVERYIPFFSGGTNFISGKDAASGEKE